MTRRNFAVLQDCMPTVCLIVAVGVMSVTAWQVNDALEASHEVHEVRDAVVAGLVAEDAAFEATRRVADSTSADPIELPSPTGMAATVRVKNVSGRRILLVSVLGRRDRAYQYSCDLLPGAGPEVLGSPLNVRHRDVADRPAIRSFLRDNPNLRIDPMDDDTVSGLLEPAHTAPTTSTKVAGFVEEDSIALLRLKHGTDRRDFVPDDITGGTWRPRISADGVRVVPGNLWIDRGDKPLRVFLPRSLTIVVHGNLYLGRSVLVSGPGRLVFVTTAPTQKGAEDSFDFVDLDGNGGWSTGDRRADGGDPATFRGPVEGQAAAYLGLPGAATRLVDVAASIVAAGEFYVRAERTRLRGSLVAGHGITWAKACRLELSGDALPNVEREPLPGFCRTGGARPGLLRGTH